MSTRHNPDTSKEAFNALTPEKLSKDYKKIIEALKVLGSGNYEQISDYIQCREPNVVSRRLKELESMQLIWKPGAKNLTKRNRSAYIYQLINQPKVETTIINEFKGRKASTDFAKGLIQQNLFH